MAERPDELDHILQDCLDKIQSGEETLESVLVYYAHVAQELRPTLEAALWMQSRMAALQPRPGFVHASQRRLVEQIQQEQAASKIQPAVTGWGNLTAVLANLFTRKRYAAQFILAAALVLAFVAGTTGIAAASMGSYPGDLLYSVKRSIEKAELALTPDDAGKAEQYIEDAYQRLREVQFLLQANRTEEVPATVALFEEHVFNALSFMMTVKEQDAERAKELAASLNNTLYAESGVLRQLAPSSPPAVRDDLKRLLAVSDGMIVLVEERIPLVVATLTPTPTTTATTIPSATAFPTFTQTAVPTATRTPVPTRVVVETSPTGDAGPVNTFTPTTTPTVLKEAKDPSPTPTPTVKPTKTPKPEKTKKPKPEPTRRPPRPDV